MFETGIENFSIRSATVNDCGLILKFIRDLADYEKLAHEVVATEEDLRLHLYGDSPRAEVLIAEFEEQPAGFALFFHNFSTFVGKPGIYLEDLFVSPEFRGKGFGKSLLTCLAKIAVERNCGRLEWSVLDWNQPAIDFYHSVGAETMEGWSTNRVSGDSLQSMAALFGR